MTGITILHITGDKLVENTVELDQLGLLQQLGICSRTGGAGRLIHFYHGGQDRGRRKREGRCKDQSVRQLLRLPSHNRLVVVSIPAEPTSTVSVPLLARCGPRPQDGYIRRNNRGRRSLRSGCQS